MVIVTKEVTKGQKIAASGENKIPPHFCKS